MKLFSKFAVILALFALLFACKKERSFENPDHTIVDRIWQFKEEGKLFGGVMDSAFIRTIGTGNSLTVFGPAIDGKGEIVMQILSNGKGPIMKGAYNNSQLLFQYAENGNIIFQNTAADNFTITITSIDSLVVTGIFSGVVVDALGNKQTISDGKFSTVVAGSGNLPAVADSDYFPLQKRWNYVDVDNERLSIQNIGDTTFGVDVFKKFYNDWTGHTKYYRKSVPVYYQYIDSAFGTALDEPKQMIILQDNLEVGASWTNDPFLVNYDAGGGNFFPIRARLKCTITQKDFTASFGGKAYDNCIEVTGTLEQLYGMDWVGLSDTETITVFAKGVGIVYYQDLERGLDWSLSSYDPGFF